MTKVMKDTETTSQPLQHLAIMGHLRKQGSADCNVATSHSILKIDSEGRPLGL